MMSMLSCHRSLPSKQVPVLRHREKQSLSISFEILRLVGLYLCRKCRALASVVVRLGAVSGHKTSKNIESSRVVDLEDSCQRVWLCNRLWQGITLTMCFNSLLARIRALSWFFECASWLQTAALKTFLVASLHSTL